MAILKERGKQTGENRGKPVELDFRMHSTETVKVSILIAFFLTYFCFLFCNITNFFVIDKSKNVS